MKGLPFTQLTLAEGWWGIPFGPIFSVIAAATSRERKTVCSLLPLPHNYACSLLLCSILVGQALAGFSLQRASARCRCFSTRSNYEYCSAELERYRVLR